MKTNQNAYIFKIWTTKHKLESSIAVLENIYNDELQRVKDEKQPILDSMVKLETTSYAWTIQYEKLMKIIDNSSNIKIMIDSLKNTLSIIKSESKQIEENNND